MSNVAFNRVRRFIDENFPESAWCTEGEVIMLDFKGKNADYQAFIETRKRVLSIGVFMPRLFPEGHFWDISKAVCYANYNIEIGRFDWEYECGNFEFKASTMFGSRLDDIVIDRLIRISLMTVDCFFPAFRKVIIEGADPMAAIDFRIHDEKVYHDKTVHDTVPTF